MDQIARTIFVVDKFTVYLSSPHINPYLLFPTFLGNNIMCIFLYFSVYKILCRSACTVLLGGLIL